MSLKVCILVKSNPFLWTAHYIRAFRKRCDVITIGPSLTDEDLEKMGYSHLHHLVGKNDIECDFNEDASILLEQLPEDWTPQLVIGIQSGAIVKGIGQLSCPTAYISVDTWHDPSEYDTAKNYDAVFVAQREFVPLLKATGSRNVFWLPLACSPEAHHPIAGVEKELDVTMIGACSHPYHRDRARRLSAIGEHFNVVLHKGASTEEMCEVYARTKLAFNSSIFQDVNMRVFETMAMGCALLTNRDAEYNGLLDLFEDGKHLLAYTEDNLVELAREYISNDAAREALAQVGREEVLEHHTYLHRVDKILETMQSKIPELDTRCYQITPSGDDLSDYLPVAPGYVIDIGLGCINAAQKCDRYAGIVAQGTEVSDFGDVEVRTWVSDKEETYEADTVVMSDAKAFVSSLSVAFKIVWSILREGGTFVLRCSKIELAEAIHSEDAEALDIWFREYNFHVIGVHELECCANSDPKSMDSDMAGIDYIVVARKRTRNLREVLVEVFERHPADHITPDYVSKNVPADL